MLGFISKGRMVKYAILMAISIFLTIGLVGIFTPINRTTVLINYVALEEGGTIQLFYRQDEQDFSEDKSIVSKVTWDGRNVFKIPQLNIDELRIDIDDISIFRIKSIEISQKGSTRIIDSENWSDYYRAQFDVESLFDDGSLISYEATGIDPYIVFGIGEFPDGLGGYVQYYLLFCIGFVVCFLILFFIAKFVEKQAFL